MIAGMQFSKVLALGQPGDFAFVIAGDASNQGVGGVDELAVPGPDKPDKAANALKLDGVSR